MARIAPGGRECINYTDNYIPVHIGHIGVLTDYYSSGITIGLKIKDVTRIGLGLDSIREINDLNPGLDLNIEDLQESALTSKGKPSSHWVGLVDSLNGRGRKKNEKVDSWSVQERLFYIPYLWQRI